MVLDRRVLASSGAAVSYKVQDHPVRRTLLLVDRNRVIASTSILISRTHLDLPHGTAGSANHSMTVAARRLVVVGLGNFSHPLTRHSVGQVLLKNLAKRAAASPSRLSGSATLLSTKYGRHTSWTSRILLAAPPSAADQTPLEVLFVLPRALMNVSGPTAAAAFDGFLPPLATPARPTPTFDLDADAAPSRPRKKPPAAPVKPMLRLVTLQDDLDLAPSAVKYQRGGGPRGHNGVRSLSSALKGSRDFHRLWVGIGRPAERSEVASYVLRPLSRDEVRACEYDEDDRGGGVVLERAWEEVLRIGFEDE